MATNIITTIAGNGSRIDSGDGGQATNAAIYGPGSTYFDRHGNLFIADLGNRVRRVDATTHIITTVAGNGIAGPTGDGGPASAAEISPYGIFIDSTDNIYIACNGERIRKIDATTQIITTIAGNDSGIFNGDGIPATAAGIQPYRIAGDKYGNLFIADWEANRRIRKINSFGYIYTVAGNGIAGFSGDGGNADSAELEGPQSIKIDSCGNLYTADVANYRIRKITYPAYPTITISDGISNTENTTLCYGMPVTFIASVTLPGYAPVYQWKVNGVNVGGSASTYTYSPVNGDSVQCVMTSNLYCVTSNTAVSNVLHLVVDSLLVPVVTLSGVSGAAIGDTVTVTATITGAASSYLLHWKNHGIEFATTTGPSVSYVKTMAIDSITATLASNGRSCYDSAFSPAKIVALPSSTPELTSVESFTCYPNPATSVLYLVAGFEIHNVVITDIFGQVVYEFSGFSRQLSVDVKGLKSGVYFVRVNGVSGERFVKM